MTTKITQTREIEFPLSIKDMEDLLDVSKSSLYRWEKEGYIKPERDQKDNRRYGTEDLRGILILLQEMRGARPNSKKYPWVQGIKFLDPNNPIDIVVPDTGCRIHLDPFKIIK